MAFFVHSVDDGSTLPIEYLPCSTITPVAGMALTLTDGNLAVAGGTTKPTYISMRQADKGVEAGEIIPVLRVGPGVIFETELSENGTDLKLGDKVTLDSGGLGVTATTESGTAELVAILGTAAGDRVRVRFA